MVHEPEGFVPLMRPNLPPRERFAEVVADVFETRMLSNFSKYSQLLEARASSALGHPGVQCVSSCDIGLALAWKALECPAGEVVVPSFTFCSTANALRWNALEPVFADVDPETYCIDVNDVRRLITRWTVGICAVHAFGLPADIEPLQQLAAERGLKLVFDAAHGLGGRYRGAALGPFGDASVFSMSGTKLVTSGEGGLATFRNPEAADRFSHLRAYGFKGDYNCRYIGLNGKLSELNAALGWLSLAMIDDALTRRQAQVEHYRRALDGCAGVAWQATPPDRLHGYKDLALRFRTGEERATVERALQAAGVMTKRYFFPVHRMEAYRPFARRPLPVTESLYDRLLCVPLFHDLSFERIDEIARVIRNHVSPIAVHKHEPDLEHQSASPIPRDLARPFRSEVA